MYARSQQAPVGFSMASGRSQLAGSGVELGMRDIGRPAVKVGHGPSMMPCVYAVELTCMQAGACFVLGRVFLTLGDVLLLC